MLTPETASNAVSKKLYLAEASPLSELDSWVEEYIQSGNRFTFTEDKVLKSLWDEGEDIRLREDSRFQEGLFGESIAEKQWQLVTHILANQDLFELIMDGFWDGCNLYACLESLDHSKGDTTFHIFCSQDERFRLSQDENGLYNLSLSAEIAIIELTGEQKKVLEQLMSQSLAHFTNNSRKPWSTSALLDELIRLSPSHDVFEKVVFAAFESWLLGQEKWVRVGVDSWLPKSELPHSPTRHRYAILPIFSPADDAFPTLPNLLDEENIPRNAVNILDDIVGIQEQPLLNKRARWRVTLRTCHINEGTIPVPKQARLLYPHARKLVSMIALPGLWFADGSDITVWLDKTKHELLGTDLQDQFAFLEAGEMLEVEWTQAGLMFRTLGVDPMVAEEESRLLDLTHLAQLRSTTLESYRASLRAIMRNQNKALSFQDIYEELSNRQQHKPNRNTIRSILSSSPEFVFVKDESKWSLNLSIASDIGAKLVRRFTTVAKQVEGESGEIQQQKPISLSQMLATNRQHINNLRAKYLHEN